MTDPNVPIATDTLYAEPRSPEQKAALVLSLRQGGVRDQAVLDALVITPREDFIPQHNQKFAWADSALDIGLGQTISQPLIVAKMTAALSLHKRAIVLEIGTGCGYQTAILAKLSRFVYSVERLRAFTTLAEQRLTALGYSNVALRHGDGHLGWPQQAPFHRIIVTAAPPKMPPALPLQLDEDGGIMVIPLGAEGKKQQLLRLTRMGKHWREEWLDDVRFVPLCHGVDTTPLPPSLIPPAPIHTPPAI